MNGLDLVILGLLALAAISGFRRGAALQVLTYGGLLVGLAIGALLAPRLAALGSSPAAQSGIAIVTLLVAAGLGDLAGWLAGGRVRAAARRSRLSAADAAAGSLLAVGALLLAVWFVALNLVNGPVPAIARGIQRSRIVRTLDRTLPQPPPILAEARRFLDRFGFPEVFAGLPPAPAGPVEAPTQAEAREAFEAAADSTVRIVGDACGFVQEGSGFVVAPGYVATNAHVLAGVVDPEIQGPDGAAQPGRTVLFDAGLDVAVLRSGADPGPPLRLEEGAGRGDAGAVVGYPQGGGLTGTPAAVRRSLPAEGRDIYGREAVSRRVHELQAAVRPGNSGGPFVLASGRAAGIVFAGASTDRGVGYAVTAEELAPVVDRAVGRTAEVDTGPCLR